jgi:hypothetical protein
LTFVTRSDGPSWIDLAAIRVNKTEPRFAAFLNRLLQQNPPQPDVPLESAFDHFGNRGEYAVSPLLAFLGSP